MRNERGLRAGKRREKWREEEKIELRKAAHDHGLAYEVLADSAGVDASYVSRKASDACKDSTSLLELGAWLLDDECAPVAERLLRTLLSRAGYDLVRKRTLAGDADAYRFLDEDLARSNALHRQLVQATSEQSEAGREYSEDELRAIRECILARDRRSTELLGAIEERLGVSSAGADREGGAVLPLPARPYRTGGA